MAFHVHESTELEPTEHEDDEHDPTPSMPFLQLAMPASVFARVNVDRTRSGRTN